MAYPWKTGTRYKIYVTVKQENGDTIYSAWFGQAGTDEWLLAGRIRKKGLHHLGHAGGFLEHAGTKNMEARRTTAYGPAWVHDGKRWHACTRANVTLKDPQNASFRQEEDGTVIIQIGLGLKSEAGQRHTYTVPVPSESPPKLPEEPVASKTPPKV